MHLLSRLFSRKNLTPARTNRVSTLEGLEGRVLMTAAPKISQVIADNRGEVTMISTRTLTGVSKSSVKLFTGGADGIVGTVDDVRVPAQVVYNVDNFRITVKGKLAAGTGYRVRIDSKLVTSLDGRKLDGEFNPGAPSGNGVPGGNFAFQAKSDKSSTPTVRMSTNLGTIVLRLRGDVAPKTVANFLAYANSGRFDNVFFTRSENSPSPFVIQGGSLQITDDGAQASDIIATTRDTAVEDENSLPGALSNTIGTISFAKSGPNTATNQFFINLADNSFLDSPARSDGGFTPFAEITSGLSVAQAINAKPTTDLTGQIGTVASSTNTGVSKVPVNDAGLAQNLNPFRDLQYIRKTAPNMKISAVA
jgi:cyclophilin family peptidyl-prolyl cis-trans isomerase